MDKEKLTERFEKIEEHLKERLKEVQERMLVKDWNWGWKQISLLEIYGEWMNYLVKNNINNKNPENLLNQWYKFLLQRNTDHVADLLTGFFEAKRRYGRDEERWEHQWDWFALCKNYCERWWWHSDEDLVYRFFSSYSGAERRIRTKIDTGKVLVKTSDSLLETMRLTREEIAKKEEEKKRRKEEKKRKDEEKQRKKEERARNAEENKLKKVQNKKSKKIEARDAIEQKLDEENFDEIDDEEEIDEWAVNHYGGNDRDIMNEDGDVVPNPDQMHIPQELIVESEEVEKREENKLDEDKKDLPKPPKLDKDGKQYLIDFPDDDE